MRPSRSALDLRGAAIQQGPQDPDGQEGQPRPPAVPSIALPNQDAEYVNHIALDMGGSLIKLVYFSPESSGSGAASPRGGQLHFVKFETRHVEDVISFIEAKGLHRFCGKDGQKEMRVICTGGGAFRYAELFKQRLGVVLDCEDEMSCLVSGCNFLLKAIHQEAFTYEEQATAFVPNVDSDLYPYLLVNIGSGVSIVKVEGDGKYERISGSSLGGGTFWGLAKLLTQRKDFDEVLLLSMKGDNANVDMLVGDIYGGRDYSQVGLDASVIASSFGKVVGQDKELGDYSPADLSVALNKLICYNIGQLAYLNAMRYNIKRIFFGGFFIRGIPMTMQAIAYAIRFWSRGEMAATFLRHEGYLGAVGAFLKVHPMPASSSEETLQAAAEPRKVRARFVERFGGMSLATELGGAEPQAAAEADGRGVEAGPSGPAAHPPTSWVEKFVEAGAPAVHAARIEHQAAQEQQQQQQSVAPLRSLLSCSSSTGQDPSPSPVHMALNLGVLHYSPSLESFPLLADPVNYEPNTLDITAEEDMSTFWITALDESVPTLVQKAIASEGGGEAATRRAVAFGRRLSAHFKRLLSEAGAYTRIGLFELFELREECLRQAGFSDVYRLDKERENSAALSVLPDLLKELDQKPVEERLLALVQGCLAANLFDWGARSCVDLYHNGTILDMYRSAKQNLGKRPWAVDHFDQLARRLLPATSDGAARAAPSYRRVMMLVDNCGADIFLGMLPLARELLRLGSEVVLVANSLPAINDVTAAELKLLLQDAGLHCPVIRRAREAAVKVEDTTGGFVPAYPGSRRGLAPVAAQAGASASAGPEADTETSARQTEEYNVHEPKLFVLANGQGSPCMDFRRVPKALAVACQGTDLLIIEGMGRAIHTNLETTFKCDTLKLAMIKTEWLAQRLFGGRLYDCVCKFDAGEKVERL